MVKVFMSGLFVLVLMTFSSCVEEKSSSYYYRSDGFRHDERRVKDYRCDNMFIPCFYGGGY